ncbi:MAG: hypothetical protein AAB623_01220 [Patescibacteria group bacterium]
MPFAFEYDGSTAHRLTREFDFDIEFRVNESFEKEIAPETALADWSGLDKITRTLKTSPTLYEPEEGEKLRVAAKAV